MSGTRNAEVPKLRRQTGRFLVGQPASAIPELRLPTGRSLLQCFFHVYDESNDRHTAIKQTVECVMRIWAKAGMKAQLYRSCSRKLENLWIQWNDIKKQKTGKDDKRREGFSRKMGSISDRAAEGDVHQIMSSSLFAKKGKKKTLNSIKISVRSKRKRRAP